MPIKLQNIHTGEVWIQTDSEIHHRFIHSSSCIVFDLEFDGTLSIWYYPNHCYFHPIETYLIDENPIQFKSYCIKFYSGIEDIFQEQFSAIEKTIDIRSSNIVNPSKHFNSFL